MALNYGKVLAMGTPQEVQTHPEVVRAYIGGEAEVDGMTEPLLRVDAIETFYGPIQAIRGVSLEVAPGQIVTVLGANGAGKTTRAADDLGRSRSGSAARWCSRAATSPTWRPIRSCAWAFATCRKAARFFRS